MHTPHILTTPTHPHIGAHTSKFLLICSVSIPRWIWQAPVLQKQPVLRWMPRLEANWSTCSASRKSHNRAWVHMCTVPQHSHTDVSQETSSHTWLTLHLGDSYLLHPTHPTITSHFWTSSAGMTPATRNHTCALTPPPLPSTLRQSHIPPLASPIGMQVGIYDWSVLHLLANQWNHNHHISTIT